jgi:hypothetical protein
MLHRSSYIVLSHFGLRKRKPKNFQNSSILYTIFSKEQCQPPVIQRFNITKNLGAFFAPQKTQAFRGFRRLRGRMATCGGPAPSEANPQRL